ncbi:hypothetical protein A8990_115111 [Paenibacillus taihuensis]|uniref:Uncharacterized protein n=1 Tax=Paenibacillus taihuensis TaxID=1156355 RepID=A0A3D9S798_9BACL|nr:hypothetical protein [Paenibacillus taihuensis]REE84432.1 hypothetical protein A8990_115111 [Paenibacillus taihuensis]
MPKQVLVTAIAVLFFIIAGIMLINLYTTPINPSVLGVKEVTTTDQSITLKGIVLVESATSYKGYKLGYEDNMLYIKFKKGFLVSNLKPKPIADQISIENKYHGLKAIYLQGDSTEDSRMIWPQNSTLRQ